MKKMKNLSKRGLSLLLVLVLCLSLVPFTAFATDGDVGDDNEIVLDGSKSEVTPDETKEPAEGSEEESEEIEVTVEETKDTPDVSGVTDEESEDAEEVLELRALMSELEAFDLDTLNEDNIDEFQALSDRLGELSEIVFDGDYYDGMMEDMIRFQALAEKMTGGFEENASFIKPKYTIYVQVYDKGAKTYSDSYKPPFKSKNFSGTTTATSGVVPTWTWKATTKGYEMSGTATQSSSNKHSPVFKAPSDLWTYDASEYTFVGIGKNASKHTDLIKSGDFSGSWQWDGVTANSGISIYYYFTKEATHNHDYSDRVDANSWVTAPTCTANGTATYKCSCGDTTTKTVANSALGHAWPTTWTDGCTSHGDANCTSRFVPAATAA